MPEVGPAPPSLPRSGRPPAALPAAAAPADADTLYRTTMSAFKVRILPGISATHSHKDLASKEAVQPKERLRRVGRELASCEVRGGAGRGRAGRWGGRAALRLPA